MDLLDGITLELCRAARHAARAAAHALGKPSLAEEFELSALYGPRSLASGDSGQAPAPAAPPR